LGADTAPQTNESAMNTRPKTIMHLIATNFYGGPEKQTIEHLMRLNKDLYHGVLASFLEDGRPNETLDYAKTVGLNHFGIPMVSPIDFRAQWELNKLLRQERIDLLCTHGYKSTVMGWWASRRAKIPVLAFSRGYTVEDRKVAFYEWLERRVLGKVAGIIFVSDGQKRRLESLKVHPRLSWVVHNAISVGETPDEPTWDLSVDVRERLGIPQGTKIVVSAGRLSPEKGHRFLVEAISKMGKNISDAYFIFCGDGSCMKDLENQAQHLGISGQCRFPGFRRDLHEIFRVMDLLVVPSLTEGLPNVILEAFACKKPVIATAVGGIPEVVEHEVNGVLVPPGQPDLLAKAIEKCLSSPAIARQMGKAGYHRIKSEFTFESQTRKLEQIYHEVLQCFSSNGSA
jgi:glycosyltransferase involved in cell wall biosynthesis